MKPSRLRGVLQTLLTQRWPAFVWGPPGTGKSSIVREVADSAKLPVIDLRASLLDPTDLRGIPAIDGGRAVWCPPSFLPRPNDTPGVLFLDEINAAPPLVQASLYQLVLDRRVGEYELPKGWWIVAAGNRQQDRAVTFRMSSALANRFVHVSLEVDVDDWRAWAIEKALDPMAARPTPLRAPGRCCRTSSRPSAASKPAPT
jgi:MoxR-like ATPase